MSPLYHTLTTSVELEVDSSFDSSLIHNFWLDISICKEFTSKVTKWGFTSHASLSLCVFVSRYRTKLDLFIRVSLLTINSVQVTPAAQHSFLKLHNEIKEREKK